MKIAIAIIIGATIISAGVYQGLTFQTRMAVKECIDKRTKYKGSITNKKIIAECKYDLYYRVYGN